MNTNLFGTRRECLDAIKSQGLDAKPYGTTVNGVDQFEIKLNEPKAEAVAKVAASKKAKVVAAAKPSKGKGKPVAVPTANDAVEGVCGRVRAMAASMPDATRKAVVAACVAQGIHASTAHIQTTKADKLAGRVRPV